MTPTLLATPPRTGSSPLGGGSLREELRRRRSRRNRLVALGVVALLLLLAAVAAGLVWFSSVFAARQVEVRGQRGLGVEQVQQAAAVPLGVPLARQDLDAIATRVAALPQVRAATVVRDWPRTVTVTVQERRPVLAVQQPDGYAMVDEQGVAFETRPTVPDGVLRAEADPTASTRLAELALVAAALPPDLTGKVDRISATAADDIRLTLDDGATVRWGSAAESPLKASIVTALLTPTTRSVDVSAPHNPATR